MGREVLYFYESGRKRKGEHAECCRCGKTFVRRVNPQGPNKKRFCSRECAYLARRERKEIVCAACGKHFERPRSKLARSRHGVYFCSRSCKDWAQSLKGNCEGIRPDHYGTGNGAWSYRNKCAVALETGCTDCGETATYKLIVHHKDGNRMNNSKQNLEVVCRNCHCKRHLKRIGDGWVLDLKYITPRELLPEIA